MSNMMDEVILMEVWEDNIHKFTHAHNNWVVLEDTIEVNKSFDASVTLWF